MRSGNAASSTIRVIKDICDRRDSNDRLERKKERSTSGKYSLPLCEEITTAMKRERHDNRTDFSMRLRCVSAPKLGPYLLILSRLYKVGSKAEVSLCNRRIVSIGD